MRRNRWRLLFIAGLGIAVGASVVIWTRDMVWMPTGTLVGLLLGVVVLDYMRR